MNFKKTITGISVLSMLLSSSAVTAITASAADSNEAYKENTLNTYLYSSDNVKTIDCRFYNDKPNIPYVRLSDFYKYWTDQDATITNNNDGTYEVKVPIGTTGIIDVEKDTISTEDLNRFFTPQDEADGSTEINDLMIKAIMDDTDYDPIAIDIDLGKYNIDLYGDDSDIWWPACTLCDLFQSDLKMGMCIDNELYFCNDFGSDFSRMMKYTPDYMTAYTDKYRNGRPEDITEYNYNELCLIMDLYYGFPERMPNNDILAEKGLDRMLSETNDSTRKIRSLLTSNNIFEYGAGIYMLNDYFWDGGHTAFASFPFNSSREDMISVAKHMIPSNELEGSVDFEKDYYDKDMSRLGAATSRKAMIETADLVQELSSSLYTKKGDTAVFSFDMFDVNIDGWNKYYHENGSMPEDTISDFYTAINMADSDPEVKKFVFDLGVNGGGQMGAVEYMISMISDSRSVGMKDSIHDRLGIENYTVDKNLDKVIDEKDDAFVPDLKYGVITSYYSFSCGSLLPYLAHENNILLMGERSGGGSCTVFIHTTPDGSLFQLSTESTLIDSQGNSIDKGIAPDYDLVKIAEDGSKDYSDVYNYENISRIFDEYYGKAETPAASDTTTTVTTTSVTSETTSTTAVSETQNSTSSTVTTTAESKFSAEEISKMAARDHFIKTGENVNASEAKENSDGTYTVSLTDDEGNVIDTYTIDPYTGKGTNESGNEVELPQTGMNSPVSAGTAAASAILVLAGTAAVYSSGVFRRKKDNE